jgi:Ca2+-binding RTX toxin-like protein
MSDSSVTTSTAGRQNQPSVTVTADGSYIATWVTRSADLTQAQVVAQRFGADGVPLGAEIAVSDFAAGANFPSSRAQADVAAAADGSFVVAWREGSDLLLRRFEANGTPAGEVVTAATGIIATYGEPSLAMAADGSFALTWARATGGLTIETRRFDASDTPVGGAVVSIAGGTQPTVAANAAGHHVVVWDSYLAGSDGSGTGIYAQRLDAAGVAQGAPFLVNSTIAGEQRTPSVAMDAAGNFVVVWESGTYFQETGAPVPVGTFASQFGIHAQRYDALGNKVGGEIRVNTTTLGDHGTPSVAMNAAGDFVVSWVSNWQDGSGLGVLAQRFDAAGVAQGPEFRVNLDALGQQNRPAVAVGAEGGFAIVWDSSGGLGDARFRDSDAAGGGDGSDSGAMIRVFRPDGTPAPVVVLDLDAGTPGSDRGTIHVPGATPQAVLDEGVAITAAGIPLLSGATARLEARPDGTAETLSLSAAAMAAAVAAGITVAFDAATGVLTLAGSASVPAYEAVLGGLSYANAAASPALGARVVAVQVSAPDGQQSQVARATLTDWGGTPSLTLDLDATASGTGSAATVLVAEGPAHVFGLDVAIGAVGINSLTGATVLLGDRQNGAAEALGLSAEAQAAATAAGITASWDATAGLLTLTGNASAAAYEAALEGVRYAGPATAATWTRTLSVTLTSEDGTTASATGTLMVDRSGGADVPIGVSDFRRLSRPDIAADGDGNWLVTWESREQDGSGTGIFLQRVDGQGKPLSPILQVNTTTANNQIQPALAVAEDGSFVVAWTSSSPAGIQAQRFDATGAKLGEEIQVSDAAPSGAFIGNVDVGMDAAGNFTVVWHYSAAGTFPGFDVYARRFDADGAALSDPFIPATVAADRQSQPVIAVNADGAQVMAWASNDLDGSGLNIYARRYDADGQAVGGQFLVNTTTAGNQNNPAVAMDAAGNFVIAWDIGGGIYAQRYSAEGGALGGEFRVGTGTSASSPEIAMRPDGSFFIAWSVAGGDGSGSAIFAQRFSATGEAEGGEFRANGATTGSQRSAAIAIAEDGRLGAVWDQDGDRSVILGRFFNPDGSPSLFDLDGSAPGSGFAVTYTAGGGPVGIADTDAVLSSVLGTGFPKTTSDSNNIVNNLIGYGFTHATAKLDGRRDGVSEFLFLDAVATGLVASWDEPSGTLTLRGPVSTAEFLAAIKAIRYLNTDETPTGGDRSVEVRLYGPPISPVIGNINLDFRGETVATEAVVATITVTQPNRAPTAIDLSAATVTENAAGAVIGTLTVADPDAGSTHAFTLSDSRFEVVGGALKLRDGISLNFEAAPAVTLEVTATDAGGLSFTRDITVQVTDLPEGGRGTAGDDTLSGADKLYGLAGNDQLIGGAGNDLLDGGSGADSMTGGAGDDTYVVDDAGDVVVELPGGGYDRVISSISHTLAAGVERLSLAGTASINGTGNTLDNRISGNDGANILDGGGGSDRLDGGLGADVMTGGAGDDTYVVDDTGDVVVELPGGGYDRVVSSISLTLGAETERLSLAGTASINGTGNTLDNHITGNGGANILDGGEGNDALFGGVGNDQLVGGEGNDLLDGGLGADVMTGGAGDDTYMVDDAGDVVVELSGGSNDRVISSISHTLAAGVERLILTGRADLNGTGNTLDNRISGNDGANILDGGEGNDALFGGVGNDQLLGGGGSDRLDGGLGADLLTGGAGNDVFRFFRGQAEGDVLTDFTGNGAAAGDRLEFRGYGTAAQGASFTQIDATSWLIVSADGLAEEVITFAGGTILHSSDWSLL